MKKHLARNHTKLYREKYAKWSKEEILLENEDSDLDGEEYKSELENDSFGSSQNESHIP